MNNLKLKFYIIIGLQILFLIGLIIFKQFSLVTGEEVLLKTIPVDPRSLFRGNYVMLNYEISTLDLNKVPADYYDFEHNDVIWIKLKKEAKFWSAKSVHRRKPSISKNEVAIKGRVMQTSYGEKDKKIDVKYGIESYFTSEEKAKEIEKSQRKSDISVKIAVDRLGNAVIKKVLVDGESL